ncbi:helix-turn-helix transcriptional regulator [Pantoea sp. GM01]|uniref:helix-turn-helix domain-containing protein n=1 Tax=Pantoea sp. GM01 TaxID=1144320 RepID=UPI00027125D1|nr:LuxR C-terminal-related transcriptional regulator [Pantoea sp. GM01]EJL85166.1 response regulator containing a CheY-like receiver domain and an HTH DNA-binding domain [Pantoea sp. GM01]
MMTPLKKTLTRDTILLWSENRFLNSGIHSLLNNHFSHFNLREVVNPADIGFWCRISHPAKLHLVVDAASVTDNRINLPKLLTHSMVFHPELCCSVLVKGHSAELVWRGHHQKMNIVLHKENILSSLPSILEKASSNMHPIRERRIGTAQAESDLMQRKAQLSQREKMVLQGILAGLTLTQIALRERRSVKTLSTQKMRAMSKLGISTLKELNAISSLLELNHPRSRAS